MLTMDQIHLIRMLFYEQGKSISEIARELNISWHTVQKYVDMDDFNQPAPTPETDRDQCPKLDPFKPLINQWLLEDKKAPRKQRHTAKRVWDRLRQEAEDFNCSYRLVAGYVKAKKKELHLENQDKGKLPIIHYPGEAQGDFGAASFYENGTLRSGKYFVLSFPYSNQGYFQLNYGENMECLLEALDAIFRHIGGVPTEIWFDNTSTIVTDIIKGGGRTMTERFTRFREHYGFRPVFCNPEAGYEKGNGEAKVGYSRRNFLVPVPEFADLASYNRELLLECDKDGGRDHYCKDKTIWDLFCEDKNAMLPLPAVPFELAGFQTGIHTNGWGKFTLNNGKHEYSASPEHANSVVTVKLTSATVTVLDGNLREIVTHRRLYGNERQESMEWVPYLSYISRHPRSLKNTGIYAMMPDEMKAYLDSCNGTDRGKVLKTLAELTTRTGFDSALNTVSQAIRYHATDADSLENLYRRLYMDVPELPPMDMQGVAPQMAQMPSNLIEYDKLLLKRGGAANG